jgi:Flp pilus assembly protein TadG
MIMLGLRRIKLVLGACRVSKRFRQWPSGQAGPLIAGVIIALLGSVALGTDVAVHYYNWAQLQKAADAGVLAGANWLPDEPTKAIDTAVAFAESNGVTAAEVSSTTVAGDKLSITMQVQRTVPYYFAKVLNMTSATLQVSATAAPQGSPKCVGASSCSDSNPPPGGLPPPTPCTKTGDCQLIPIGLDHDTVYSNGESITLQQSETKLSGNWDLLALGGVGGNNLRQNIAIGASSLVSVGDCSGSTPSQATGCVTTEPGKKVGPVDQGFQDRIDAANISDPGGTFSSHSATDPRVLVLPVVTWEGKNGRGQVPVDAFATVWLDGYGSGNHGGEVYVHFISQVVANSYGDSSSPNYGGHGHPVLVR